MTHEPEAPRSDLHRGAGRIPSALRSRGRLCRQSPEAFYSATIDLDLAPRSGTRTRGPCAGRRVLRCCRRRGGAARRQNPGLPPPGDGLASLSRSAWDSPVFTANLEHPSALAHRTKIWESFQHDIQKILILYEEVVKHSLLIFFFVS